MPGELIGTQPRYANFMREDKRRVPPEVRKTWQVSNIWDRHHKIKRLIFLGMSNSEIAERLDCHKQTVSLVRNSKVIQDQLSLMHAEADAKTIDIAAEIKEFAPVAMQFLKDIVNGERVGKDAPVSLRAREANNFLDRAGYVKKVKFEGMMGHLTMEQIEEIKQNALKTAKINGQIVEGEVIDDK